MRTFIAFDLDSGTKNNIQEIQNNYKKCVDTRITYTKQNQFHITVFFLDEITEKRAETVKEILLSLPAFNPSLLQFEKLEYFPSPKKPRVIVLKSEADEYLKDFVSGIDKKLFEKGFKRDKKWLPHITLGRVRENLSVPEFSFNPFHAKIESLTLYKSTLSTIGSIYEKLIEINTQG